MSCIFGKNYESLNKPCLKGIMIKSGSESFNCDFYRYNGELKEPEQVPPFNWNGGKLEELI